MVGALNFIPSMRIRSFEGLVPVPQHAAAVAAVPYDVVNREEAAALAKDHPLNLLHVDRAEIDLPTSVDPYDAQVYAQAAKALKKLQDDGVLVRESGRCMYLYRQTVGAHSQTGLVTTCNVEDYELDVIKKHEKTRQDKEDDRTKLVDSLSANTGPIFLTYKGCSSINAIIQRIQAEEQSAHDFTADDGVRHQVWKVGRGACVSLESLFAERVENAYIADGHHRAASAFRVGKLRRAANPNATGEEDFNWFLSVLFPGNELNILPYNRAVKDFNGQTQEEFVSKVENVFSLKYTATKEPTKPGQCCMYTKGQWHVLEWQPEAGASPIDLLDVSILQNKLLAPVLGIDDPRTSKRIDFIGGIRGTAELERLVDDGLAVVAFSMYPVTVDQLMAISDAGQIMPPKSTWFEPKLRSGLFIHTFES
ncbi:MAG: SpoOJ/ParA/ParB/repB family protein [Verrucomicrobiaceae bacterium]|nr:SpoOJ/ParA/ParB/repB family protein [Verrucomicrobiaceae bacterium]